MTEHITPATTLEQALKVIDDTADYYHQMTDSTSPYWFHNYWSALDLLERIQGLPEGSLMNKHDVENPDCTCSEGADWWRNQQ
jgi:hypothetical protein